MFGIEISVKRGFVFVERSSAISNPLKFKHGKLIRIRKQKGAA